MTEEPNRDAEHLEDFTPRGALFFGAIFLILMIALWGTVYWMLLER